MAETRKLAAILAADVVGYSKLDALLRSLNLGLLGRRSPPNIGHVLFVLVSGDQTAFAFDASAILRRQEGLYVINALPRRKRCFGCRTRYERGRLTFS